MCFQVLPKLSVAGELILADKLFHTHGTVTAKLVAESGTLAWNSECSVGR